MRSIQAGAFVIHIAETRRERMRGLRELPALGPDEGLLLERCRSVHTFGMAFPIDAVLLDARVRPLGVRSLAPGRLLLPRRKVRHIVEVRAGRGDALCGEILREST